ncbi:MAG: ABC-F family ATP-binding cassette domain-containing protein [Chloroflexota bacterium]
MAILTVQNLGLAFGARDVFTGISVELQDTARVGLVGPNGVGKTSLFRILAGLMQPNTGSVHFARGARLGYLRQEAVEAFSGHEHSVYDEMLTVFADLREHEARLRAIEAVMADGEVSDELLVEYGARQEDFERAGGYDYESRIHSVLQGLGFGREQWGTAMSHLSGGQKTRALLARLLLERPNLLILDEPTNHLDLAALNWLERTLRNWSGALLIASHDRYFLDRVVDHIWEMSPHHVETYRGNYTAYVHQREERWERNQRVFEAELERLQREMELIRRYIAWRKFDEAWGKLKRLSRELLAIQSHGLLGIQGKSWSEMGVHKAKMMPLDEAHDIIKSIKPPAGRPPRPHVRLRPTRRSGQIVLRTTGLEVGYDGTPLFACDDIHLERLERVAIIGPNGAGKTSFLRTILGDLPPVAGDVHLGASLTIGYFAQAHDALDWDNTVLDELLRHKNLPLPEARNYLAQYLFRGDDVFKKVGMLSGGERGRLALAVLTLDGVNCLLLDEPTNHLDIPAREVLQEGLERFDGTLIMVSHDRYLVAELATQIWELADGRLRVFKGTYAELLDMQEAEDTREAPVRQAVVNERKQQARDDKVERKRAQKLAELEERIARAEAGVAAATRQLELCDGSVDAATVTRFTEEYGAAQAELEALMEQWAFLAVDSVQEVPQATGMAPTAVT